MSLYYDAASILTSSTQRGSLKSRIYAKDANFKAKPAHVYALISETAKYDVLLKEVIDNADILSHEPKLTPLLALLLVHDHFFAKGGIAAGSTQPLRQAIERHKARLQSEFTKARLKRRAPNIEQLKGAILKEKGINGRVHLRWVRVNTLKSGLNQLVQRHFSDYQVVGSVEEVANTARSTRVLYHDIHIPNLLVFPPDTDLTKHLAYMNGEIILQDKASCFPAHLLAGDDAKNSAIGGAIDGCAAPGNKTTHLAALLHDLKVDVYACERDAIRSKILQMMVDKAGASRIVKVLSRQDFLALDPHDPRFQDVTHLLLDPSCSGSGILGREGIPELTLPENPRDKAVHQRSTANSKKRKRGDSPPTQMKGEEPGVTEDVVEDDSELEQQPIEATKARLEKLSNLQSRIVEHAFAFPAAKKITYSTCSIYVEENEAVVARVLDSKAGMARGWRVLKQEEQVHGMRIWRHRGVNGNHGLSDEQREACIRCTPDDGEGTMGFFVCGFVRDSEEGVASVRDTSEGIGEEAEDDWEGFSDTSTQEV